MMLHRNHRVLDFLIGKTKPGIIDMIEDSVLEIVTIIVQDPPYHVFTMVVLYKIIPISYRFPTVLKISKKGVVPRANF